MMMMTMDDDDDDDEDDDEAKIENGYGDGRDIKYQTRVIHTLTTIVNRFITSYVTRYQITSGTTHCQSTF